MKLGTSPLQFIRTTHNSFVFDLLICENFIIYHGEKYTIKQTAPKVEGDKVFIEVSGISHNV